VQSLFGSQVEEIQKDRVRLRAGERTVELPNDYVCVFAGGEPPFKFFRQIGVRFGGEEKPGQGTTQDVRADGACSRSPPRGTT
jgi:thioredoxin reductase